MRKYFAVVLAVVFVLGFAASAFAIHAEIPSETQAVVAKGATQITIGGEIRVRGEYQQNTGSPSTVTSSSAAYDERVRLSVNAKVTPNTQAQITLESINNDLASAGADLYVWGTNTSRATGIYNKGNQKGVSLNLLEAWILHTGSGLLGVPAGVKVGHMPLALGNGLFFDHTKFGDDALVFFADPTKELHVGVLNAKFSEGSSKINDDADAYVGLFTYKTKEFGFSGDITYVDDQAFSPKGLHFWNFGLRGNASVANFGLMADIELQSGKAKGPDTKFSGYAFKLGANTKMDPVKLALDFAWGSGDDTADNKVKAFVTDLGADLHYSYVYEYRTKNACGIQYGGLCNTWYIHAGAETDLMKDLAGKLDLYYLQAVKKWNGVADLGGAKTNSKNIGFEVDAKVTYKVDRNLNYWVEGGYLFAGDFFVKDAKDAYAVRHGIQLNF